MKILVDTHVLLWFAVDDRRLSTKGRKTIESGEHELFLSPIAAVEISIKYLAGKLRLSSTPASFIAQLIDKLRLIALPITLEHGLAVADLPLHHRDPFDRLLIAQARYERIPILTGDRLIRQYDVQVIW